MKIFASIFPMFSSESPFGKTFGSSVHSDPLASFGWRGISSTDAAALPNPQSTTSMHLPEEDHVPMILEAAPSTAFPTSPRGSGSRQSGLVTMRSRRSAAFPADSTWVTIFGVQPHQTALAKAQVEQLLNTEIIDVRPGGGNFFHARFPTTSDARTALQLNGHMIDGSLIIGVTPCILTGLDEEPFLHQHSPAALTNAASRRKTLVPGVSISKQPSIFDPIWRVLDNLFQYN
jgi:hypothetical protein